MGNGGRGCFGLASLGSVDIRLCGGIFGQNPRLPRQKCQQVSDLAAFFFLHTRIFPQKTAAQAEYQQTLVLRIVKIIAV